MNRILYVSSLLLLVFGCNGGKSSSGGTTTTSSAGNFANCGQITEKNACNAKGAVKGKECIFMVDECMSKSSELKEFMSKDQSFKSEIKEGTDIFGYDHGEHPLWDKICNDASLAHRDTKGSIREIVFDFQKEKNAIKLIVKCTSGGPAEYNFTYKAHTLDNGSLRIHFDKGSETLVEEMSNGTETWQQEQLDFFVKPPWFYNKDKKQIKGSSQLVYMGFRKGSETEIEIKTEEDIDKAIAFAKTDQYGIKIDGTRNGAITLILNQ